MYTTVHPTQSSHQTKMYQEHTFSIYLKEYYCDDEWEPHVIPQININYVNGTNVNNSGLLLPQLLPSSEIIIPEFREQSVLENIDPFDEWKTKSYENSNPEEIFEMLDNWHFRQFCRNWCPNEVNKLLLLQSAYGESQQVVPTSHIETLLACYFIKKKYDSSVLDSEKDRNRMESLMSYRSSKFVHDLFVSLDDPRNYQYWNSPNDLVVFEEMCELDLREHNIITKKYTHYDR